VRSPTTSGLHRVSRKSNRRHRQVPQPDRTPHQPSYPFGKPTVTEVPPVRSRSGWPPNGADGNGTPTARDSRAMARSPATAKSTKCKARKELGCLPSGWLVETGRFEVVAAAIGVDAHQPTVAASQLKIPSCKQGRAFANRFSRDRSLQKKDFHIVIWKVEPVDSMLPFACGEKSKLSTSSGCTHDRRRSLSGA